ncbi:hypothetical protein M0R72_11945 [Candidatus Pacearchaeota archaeon]|jgi:hypothetical protein|nr:hypothetical protein [Candidatus Pacearchaeota archaeon]
MPSNFSKKSITIREDQASWLEEHPEINLSGHVQRWLDKLIGAVDGEL